MDNETRWQQNLLCDHYMRASKGRKTDGQVPLHKNLQSAIKVVDDNIAMHDDLFGPTSDVESEFDLDPACAHILDTEAEKAAKGEPCDPTTELDNWNSNSSSQSDNDC